MLTESRSNSLFNFQWNPVFEQNVHYIQPSLSHSHEVIVVRTKFKKLWWFVDSILISSGIKEIRYDRAEIRLDMTLRRYDFYVPVQIWISTKPHQSGFHACPLSWSNWNLRQSGRMLVLVEGSKPTNSGHITRTRAHWWKTSALANAHLNMTTL